MIQTAIHIILDPRSLIAAFGLAGVIAIVFLETGFFFGFFFPGDSLLFTAGLIASQGYLPIWPLVLLACVAAVAGDSVGYAFGKKVGPALFTREDSRFFKKEYLAKAQHFYEKYGSRTIIFARFLPIVRTFAPIVAGIGTMEYKRFLRFNVVGGVAWVVLLTMLGYGFGNIIPDPDRYLLPAIALIIAVSVIPVIKEIYKRHKKE